MKTFKQFIKEQDELGEIDIYAKEPGGELEALGQVTGDGKGKISKFIDKVSRSGDDLIKTLISDSGFDTPQYHRSFRSILEEVDVNWERFENHVKNRMSSGLKLTDIFAGKYGEVNFVEEFKPITDSLLNDPERDGNTFFSEIFTLSHKMSNTAVGDGEFLLGIIGNGVKGKVGDVDIIQMDKSTALEVGTWNKIIGTSSRDKKTLIPAYNLYNIVVNNTPGNWSEETKQKAFSLLKSFSHINDNDINYVYDLIEKNSGPQKSFSKTTSPISIILGSVVLYDYIVGHGDNYVAIINYTTGGTQAGKKWTKKRASLGLYNARYCNPEDLGLKGTIELNLNHNYFNFDFSASAVRITLGV